MGRIYREMSNNAVEWVYKNNEDDSLRYELGEKGQKNVACIGINPSTAKPNDLDQTLDSVKRITGFNGYDGWVMYNIYPLRATNPKELPIDMNGADYVENAEIVRQSVIELGIDTIWVAWGYLIDTRAYLHPCLVNLYANLKDLNLNWVMIEEPTKKGHPLHPLYKKAANPFKEFDMEKYMSLLGNS